MEEYMAVFGENFRWGQFVYYGKKLRDLQATADRFVVHVLSKGWLENNNADPSRSKGVGFEKRVTFDVSDLLTLRKEQSKNELQLRQLKYRLACLLNDKFAVICGSVDDAFKLPKETLEKDGLIDEVKNIMTLITVIEGDGRLAANISEH